VEFCREPLAEILGNGVDHLFCNEEEALSWAATDRLDIAIKELRDVAASLNITLGAKGSLVVNGKGQTLVPGNPVKALDTTGAGDMYAGGCLYGWVTGMSPEQAAGLGNYAAAKLIQHLGARLRTLDEYRQTLKEFTGTLG
jgi:sugar/nucleoside kinase (ribokinase family)